MDSAAQVKQRSPLCNPPLKAEDIDYSMTGAPHEFYWTNEKDPHTLRRKAIMKKYPQVTKLTGHEPLTKWISLFVVTLQFTIAYLLRNTHPFSWKFLLTAYFVGAFANQNCFLCIHELSHNLGFKRPLYNRLFSIISNLPIGIPYSASFQPYHQLHHKFLGDEVYDTDIPTQFEAFVLSSVLGKAFFATFQILFYALRPMFITSVDFTSIHLLNVLIQFFVDYLIVDNWGWYSLIYFIMSSFMAGSLHPTAGHFVAEHYVFDTPKEYVPFESKPPPETYSYYGPLNFFTWNVGYHTEHHDFPFIAWSKLPLLKDVAPEFYTDLPEHKSWCWVIVDFIFNYDVSMYSRVKRRTAGLNARKSVNFNDNSK
jgi:sphingolipid delta-4 desaturase